MIHQQLTAAKGTNYSTTVKMLSIMLEKGLVKRDETIPPHVYRAAVSRSQAELDTLYAVHPVHYLKVSRNGRDLGQSDGKTIRWVTP